MILRTVTLFIVFFSSLLFAHTNRTAYLEIKAIEKTKYEFKWKNPILNQEISKLSPLFPTQCKKDESTLFTFTHNNINHIYGVLNCKKSLLGENISIENIHKEMATVIFYYSQNNISYFSEFTPNNPTLRIKKSSSLYKVLKDYTILGVKHILLGYDHLLFVLGLMLLIRGKKRLIQTITAFTVAHSITLGITSLQYVYLSENFIEAIIALSIVILAVEIIYAQNGKNGLSSKYPWVVAFSFGLIHGFGFASVLSGLGLPQEHLIPALLFFNIGIELGQLLFIIILLLTYYTFKQLFKKEYIIQGKIMITYIIGTIGSFWLIERVL